MRSVSIFPWLPVEEETDACKNRDIPVGQVQHRDYWALVESAHTVQFKVGSDPMLAMDNLSGRFVD